jgi:hypothetical protein
MKFFPHNLTSIPSAVSASITSRSLFLNNFSGTPVNLASVALNITGSRGASGISHLVIGPQGPRGPEGPKGPTGDGIYILPASRTYCTCNAITGRTAALIEGGLYNCNFTSTTYYSNCDTIAAGCILYTDLACVSTVSNGLYTFNNIVYTAASGVLTQTDTCST